MIQTAITRRITTLKEAEVQFNLLPTTDVNFFPEWREDLPTITEIEKTVLDRIRDRYRYRYHRVSGNLAESLVNLVVLSPLLELAGFYDVPFQIKGEVPIEVSVISPISETESELLRGRLNFLVVSNELWIVVLESKGTELNLDIAIPQTLAYMMANPQSEYPTFAMITNGGEFFFIKVIKQGTPQYDISRIFSHLSLNNEFYEVLRILKKISNSLKNVILRQSIQELNYAKTTTQFSYYFCSEKRGLTQDSSRRF